MGDMIVFGPGVAKTAADSACASHDKEISQLRAEGRLEAGKKTMEALKWTPETLQLAHGFAKILDLSPLDALGIASQNISKDKIKWIGPIVYSDVLPNPVIYGSSAAKGGFLGILALGTLKLPEIGDSGAKEIQSGSVAYFRDSDSIVYRSCGGGRGILFYITPNDSV
ncbi:hypothetical protein EAF04_010116 [Stromatinia cepivora]|nr:hypothetical protein EAF04_010116 [Stromatinia cepivora]